MGISFHLDRMIPMILDLWKHPRTSLWSGHAVGGEPWLYIDHSPSRAVTWHWTCSLSDGSSRHSFHLLVLCIWLPHMWGIHWCHRLLPMGFPHLQQPDPQIPSFLCPDSPRVEPFLISHSEGSWMLTVVSSSLLAFPRLLLLPGTVIFICLASGVFDCGGTCSVADTKAQALTSRTFSWNISSAGGYICLWLHAAHNTITQGLMLWPSAMRKHISNFLWP